MLVEIQSVDEMHSLINSGDRIVMKFGAPWCGPCKILDPIFKKLAESEESSKIIFSTVDVQALPDAAAVFGIRGIPALMGFNDSAVLFQKPGSAAILTTIISDLKAL